jgi:cytochrome c peroxidase
MVFQPRGASLGALMVFQPRGASLGALFVTVLLAGASGAGLAAPASPTPDEMAALGRAIFFDKNLSEPAGTSCASCHDPARAFSGDNGSKLGVPRGSRPNRYARRSSPSLLYLKYVPPFRYYQEEDDPGQQPFGGLFWDGRANTITDLARQPLLNPDEMNNRDGRSIAAKIASGPYAGAFRRAFGAAALDDPEAALAAVGRALEAFLVSPPMAPFSSKYDDFIRGRAQLSPLEAEGMRLFKDPAKGGCLGCHKFSDTERDPVASPFTDYGYDAVGAPRNPRAPVRAKPDLGLCERTDHAVASDDPMYCASFRTPSLRNVAVRPSYMHNGAFTELRDVVAFYATRQTDPRRWYRSGVPFEDVPKRFRRQVNTVTPPYDRRTGDPPALNEHEIDAVVAFLRTLTDAAWADGR